MLNFLYNQFNDNNISTIKESYKKYPKTIILLLIIIIYQLLKLIKPIIIIGFIFLGYYFFILNRIN